MESLKSLCAAVILANPDVFKKGFDATKTSQAVCEFLAERLLLSYGCYECHEQKNLHVYTKARDSKSQIGSFSVVVRKANMFFSIDNTSEQTNMKIIENGYLSFMLSQERNRHYFATPVMRNLIESGEIQSVEVFKQVAENRADYTAGLLISRQIVCVSKEAVVSKTRHYFDALKEVDGISEVIFYHLLYVVYPSVLFPLFEGS